MALPTDPGQWPPRQYDRYYKQLDIWDAWYSGDPNRLAVAYGALMTSQNTFTPKPTQYAGGLVGWIARMFWGTPTPAGEAPGKMHIPVAGDIATTSADLLFAEPPKITIPEDKSGTTEKRLIEILEDNGFDSTLLEAAEVQSALSGVYLRVTWDKQVSGCPIITAVHPDCAIPEFTWGRLTAATFWSVISRDGDKYIRHLERHEPGVILNGLYAGTRDTLGTQIDLQAAPETAGLEPVNPTGIPYLTAVYVPNMLPNRLDRGSPLGISDYAGIETSMDALDEVFTSWMRDIDLGRGRVIIPEEYLRDEGRGKGASFDADRKYFSGLNIMPDSGQQMTIVQFAIRVQEHADTALALTKQIVRGAKYSPRSFGIVDQSRGSSATATEIRADIAQSLSTRQKKTRYWKPALEQINQAALALDRSVFGNSNMDVRPAIEFPRPIREDINQLASTADLLRRAQAASTQVLVELVHPEWEEPQVNEEVARITAESGQAVPNLEQMFQQQISNLPDSLNV